MVSNNQVVVPGAAAGGLSAAEPLPVADASRLYNMRLAGMDQKPVPLLHRVSLDKLRVVWVTTAGPECLESVWCRSNLYPARPTGYGGRTLKARAWSGDRGDEGVVYYEHRRVEGGRLGTILVEFNPCKVDVLGQWGICHWLRSLNLKPWMGWVERFDVAIDYVAGRSTLLLDDPVRLSDRFGCGPKGCETERTGFRAGSRLRLQLYDKAAERSSRGFEGVAAGLTRFEVSVRPEVDALVLRDLPAASWPCARETVRWAPFEPELVESNVERLLLWLALSSSMRQCRAEAKLCLCPRKRDVFFGSVLPEVHPAPVDAFRVHWADAVVRDAAGFFSQSTEVELIRPPVDANRARVACGGDGGLPDELGSNGGPISGGVAMSS